MLASRRRQPKQDNKHFIRTPASSTLPPSLPRKSRSAPPHLFGPATRSQIILRWTHGRNFLRLRFSATFMASTPSRVETSGVSALLDATGRRAVLQEFNTHWTSMENHFGGAYEIIGTNHRGDFCKLQAQQPNRLRPFFSALETFFFAGLSEWNLKKKWINSKKLQPITEWFWMALLVRSHRPPPVPLLNILQNSFNTY